MLKKSVAVSLLSLFLLAGCSTNKEIYYWGNYEQLVHDTYVTPGSADPETQIEQLNIDIQKSESLGKKAAPGIYAHLGYMYAMQGKSAQSEAAFKEEVSLYPESKVFIEGMLSRAKKNEENN